MNSGKKKELLEKLLEKSKQITVEDSGDPEFKAWRNLVERTLIKTFGKGSIEYKQFIALNFFYPAMVYTSESDYSRKNLEYFRKDFKILIDSIQEYIDEIASDIEDKSLQDDISHTISSTPKIFISHASKDAGMVEELIEILETIGVAPEQIFCTSFEGYGIELGDNFLDTIKSELSSNSFVLFVLTENFYKSPVCMCEMGAAWVLSKQHIPIVVPPLTFNDVKGVITPTQGFVFNNELKLNSFKEKIESEFEIDSKLNQSVWERKRDRILARINRLIEDQSPTFL